MARKIKNAFLWCRTVVARAFSAAKLGANLKENFRVFFIYIYLSAKYKFGFATTIKEGVFKLDLHGNMREVYMSELSDFMVFEDIFQRGEYHMEHAPVKSPRVIFDLGSNIGASVLYFHLKYPEALIYAFEPDPIAFGKLEKNVGGIKSVKLHNIAIADKVGEGVFYPVEGKTMSSSLTKRTKTAKGISVPVNTLDYFAKDFSLIDIIKFDIEGGEYRVFEKFDNIKKVKYLIGEVHPDLMEMDKNSFFDIFSRFKVYPRGISIKRDIVEFVKK